MKPHFLFSAFLFVSSFYFFSCDDEEGGTLPVTDEPTFTTKPAENISFTSAIVKGELALQGSTITDCGFAWATTPNPIVSDDSKHFGPKLSNENLSHNMSDLLPNTTYFFRTFFISGSTTVYGDELSFTTKRHTEVLTDEVINVSFTQVSISSQINVYDDEVFESGFVWSTTTGPTTAFGEKKYFGPQSESTSLSFSLNGLGLNTTYYIKAFVITPSGILYGDERTFTTLPEIIWEEPGAFPGGARMAAISFVIGGKAYVGLGHGRDGEDHLVWYKDFWEFDMVANTWTRKESYPGAGSSGAVAFAIAGKGYVGTGSGPGGAARDFWEYDPASDNWTQKAQFTGGSVSAATGFALNDKAYLGTGVEFGNGDFLQTFYEYDPASDNWTRKADFPGLAVDQAVGFSIGEYGYIGMGLREESWLGHAKQLWAYSPSTDSWTRKKDCPSPQSLDGSIGFAANNKGYVGLGWGGGTTLWSYDPESDEWQDAGAVAKSRISAVAIVVGNKVIIGTGASPSTYYKDFEEFVLQ